MDQCDILLDYSPQKKDQDPTEIEEPHLFSFSGAYIYRENSGFF